MRFGSAITSNAVGRVRREILGGREFLVAPLTMIVPGVLPGSKGPLYYPPEEVGKSPSDWDNIPITLYHPTDPLTNAPLSAADDGVWKRQGLGFVRGTHFDGKLKAEGWYDAELTRNKDPRVYQKLLRHEPIELSTGLFPKFLDKPGIAPDGRSYDAVAYDYQPDHLATLPDQEGACSIKDGCGVVINNRSVQNTTWGEPSPLASRVLEILLNCGGKGGKPGPCAVEKQAQTKVNRLSKSLESAKAKVRAITSQLKAAKVDLKSIKASVKAKVVKKTGDPADVKAVSDLHKLADKVVASLRGSGGKNVDVSTPQKHIASEVDRLGKRMTKDQLVDAYNAGTSVKEKWTTKAAAVKGIKEALRLRIGTSARAKV